MAYGCHTEALSSFVVPPSPVYTPAEQHAIGLSMDSLPSSMLCQRGGQVEEEEEEEEEEEDKGWLARCRRDT